MSRIIHFFTFFFLCLFSINSFASTNWKHKSHDVFAVGQAVFDFIYEIKDRDKMNQLISNFNIKEGYAQVANKKTINYLLKNFTPVAKDAGGSVNNTAAGLVALKAKATITQVLGNDEVGSMYIDKMNEYGVTSLTVRSSLDQTGVVALIISREFKASGEEIVHRTMIVYPGIAERKELYDTVTQSVIKDYKIILAEGYLWRSASNKIKKIFEYAKQNGSLTAFTFGDNHIVNAYKNDLKKWIKTVDILFSDSEQILELYDENNLDSAMKKLQQNNNITVVTMSEKGAYVVSSKEIIYIPVNKVKKVVDATGAGDQFAAGFLYGYINGKNLLECGKLGALQASKVIQKVGGKL